MKPKKIKNNGHHIKVHRLRNGEMRAAHGGKEYKCGGQIGDQCTELIVYLQQQAEPSSVLLSVYTNKNEQAL